MSAETRPTLPTTLAWVTAFLLLPLVIDCERLPTGPAKSDAGTVRGLTLVDWSANGYGGPVADSAIAALAGTGANTFVLIVTGYQADPSASSLHPADPRTPSVAAVTHALSQASARGLRLVLKPHVDVDDGSWRGRIDPIDAATWFSSYQAFIMPWAALAESVHAEEFVIGTELAGTLHEPDRWRSLIRRVRSVFSGRLTYAGSWDEAPGVPFWGDVDDLGIDAYFPVAARPDAGRLEILGGWQPWMARLETLHQQTGKPIIFTEIGYRSIDGAGLRPSDQASPGRLDLGEQADLYWAALENLDGAKWIRGAYWWNWPSDGGGGPTNTDYTPRGKPAVDELIRAWSGR